MESSPDEFTTGNKSGKWQHLLEKYEDYMTEEERTAVFAKYHSLKMGKFTEAVMKELLEDQEEKREEAQGYFQQMSAQQAAVQRSNLLAQQAQMASQYAGALGQSMVNTKNAIAGSLLSANSATISLREPTELANSISFGGETLTAKMVKKLKRLIK
jgi:hypothetical protein